MSHPTQLAIDAAKIAVEIHGFSGEVILNATDYDDVHTALAAALEARKFPGLNYHEVSAVAVSDHDGVRFTTAPVFLSGAALLTGIVTVRSATPYGSDETTKAIGTLRQRLERAENEADAYLDQRIFVVEQIAR